MTIRRFENHAPEIADSAFVDASAIVIGNVRIAEDVSVWPLSTIRGDINSITIGARTNIQDGSVLHVTHDSEYSPGGFALTIGESVTVGHNVILHACTIADHCLIGMGSTVLDGAILEERVMLGANSLVSPGKRLESDYLYLGSPAKPVRRLTDKEKQWLDYSARHYVELKNRYKNS